MEIKNKGNRLETNGGYLNYTIEDDEIIIDIVCAEIPRKGIGSALVEELKNIAVDKGLKITLYAEPCVLCETRINSEDLIMFYKNLGFELDSDDIDGKLMVWN